MKTDKVTAANEVLDDFARNTQLSQRGKSVYVTWDTWRPPFTLTKRWQCRGQDFYPVWHRQWGHGGTASTALSQLVRWILDKPVLPTSTWRYWASDACKLLSMSSVSILVDAGYPDVVRCVLCGRELLSGLDWWRLDKVSGPCCPYHSGCRQTGGDG